MSNICFKWTLKFISYFVLYRIEIFFKSKRGIESLISSVRYRLFFYFCFYFFIYYISIKRNFLFFFLIKSKLYFILYKNNQQISIPILFFKITSLIDRDLIIKTYTLNKKKNLTKGCCFFHINYNKAKEKKLNNKQLVLNYWHSIFFFWKLILIKQTKISHIFIYIYKYINIIILFRKFNNWCQLTWIYKLIS